MVGIEAEWFVPEASGGHRSRVYAGGKCWLSKPSGGHRRKVLVVKAEWWVPELNGGHCNQWVGAGAIKYNNLC